MQELINDYSKDGANGIKILTKDQAYIAAGKAIEKWRNLSGEENINYLQENFEDAWKQHDIHDKKMIDVTEAYQLLREIWMNELLFKIRPQLRGFGV